MINGDLSEPSCAFSKRREINHVLLQKKKKAYIVISYHAYKIATLRKFTYPWIMLIGYYTLYTCEIYADIKTIMTPYIVL